MIYNSPLENIKFWSLSTDELTYELMVTLLDFTAFTAETKIRVLQKSITTGNMLTIQEDILAELLTSEIVTVPIALMMSFFAQSFTIQQKLELAIAIVVAQIEITTLDEATFDSTAFFLRYIFRESFIFLLTRLLRNREKIVLRSVLIGTL